MTCRSCLHGPTCAERSREILCKDFIKGADEDENNNQKKKKEKNRRRRSADPGRNRADNGIGVHPAG